MKNNDSLIFQKYKKDDSEQQSFLRDIKNDSNIAKYINDIAGDIIRLETNINDKYIGFLVKDKAIDKYVGICQIKPAYYSKGAVSVEYAVHQDYRSNGDKYGTRILWGITDLLFNNVNISMTVLEIRGNNIASIKAAENAGFRNDNNLTEIFIEEGYNYIPYSKNNENYQPNNNIDKVISM